MKYLLITLLLLSSCTKDPMKSEQTENPNFKVDFLFEKDGCKVYRFLDGNYHYFTNCTETSSTVSCGKNCHREENIKGGN